MELRSIPGACPARAAERSVLVDELRYLIVGSLIPSLIRFHELSHVLVEL